jgi:hypothetical protein
MPVSPKIGSISRGLDAESMELKPSSTPYCTVAQATTRVTDTPFEALLRIQAPQPLVPGPVPAKNVDAASNGKKAPPPSGLLPIEQSHATEENVAAGTVG